MRDIPPTLCMYTVLNDRPRRSADSLLLDMTKPALRAIWRDGKRPYEV